MADTFSEGLSRLLEDMIPRVAAKAHRQYQAVPQDDLEQAMWLRAISLAAKLEKLLADDKEGVIWAELRRAGTRVCKEDERHKRSVRAAARGYDIEDEQFYSLRVLRILLPVYVDQGVSADRPVGRGDLGPSNRGDPAEGGDFLVMMIDLDAALKAVKPSQRRILEQFFSAPQDDEGKREYIRAPARREREKLAHSMGLTLEALEMRVVRALRALQLQLGGENPWRKPDQHYATPGEGHTTSRLHNDPDTGVPGLPALSQQRALWRRDR